MPNLKDYLQLHFIVLIWGFTAIIGLLIQIPSVELVFFRTLFASLILGLLLIFQKHTFQIERKEFLKILGTGFLIAGHWILFFGSAKVSTASVCLAGMTTATLWTSLIEPLIHQRGMKAFEIILGFIIILGLYIIFRFEFDHVLGLVMAISSAFLAALFSVINSKLIRKHDHYVITLYEMIGACIGTALFFPFYMIFFPPYHLQLIPSWMDIFWVLILAGVCTVYAYSVGVKLMKKFTPFAINLTVNLEPVYGILLAYIIFGNAEKMTIGFYFGTLIILIAVLTYPYLKKYFVNLKKRKLIKVISKRKLNRKKIVAES